MKTPLTQDVLRRLPASGDVWDTKLPGFLVRVHRSGRASYLVSLGRGRWYTVGRVERLTLQEARTEARGVLGDSSRGQDPRARKKAEKSQTFKNYITEVYSPWLREHRKSADQTLQRIESHFFPVFGSIKLSAITGFALEKWRSRRLKAGTQPGTVNRDIAALRGALGRAVDWNLLSVHPLAKVKTLEEDKRAHVRYLSPDEDRRLRTALAARDEKRRTKRDHGNAWRRERAYPERPAYGAYTSILTPLVLVALNTGLRFGELANLVWSDADLTRHVLTVRGG